MHKTIDYSDLKDGDILVDVRSPMEYKEYTIPGAVNLPLFSDEERKEIGTAYHHESVEKAKQIGMDYAGGRLSQIYSQIASLKDKSRNVVVFCERGGMRSSSVCALLNSLGMSVTKLRGGYKGYREYVRTQLPIQCDGVSFIVLHGFTGVGKTDVLDELAKRGLDVLDLEKAANHRGSLLGDVGLPEKVSQKQFESLILDTLRKRRSDVLFIEAESSRIGDIVVPKYLMNKIEQGVHVLLEASLQSRVKRIVDEYTRKEGFETEIINALKMLEKHIGSKNTEKYIEMVQEGQYEAVTEALMLKHYDPLYGQEQKRFSYELTVSADDTAKASEDICQWLEIFLASKDMG